MEYAKQFTFLKNKFESGQLSHAYLFAGPDTAGMQMFAKELVKFINGKDVAGAEQAIEKEQFPDLFLVKSQNSKSSLKDDEDKMEIDVSQVRDAQNFLSYKSYYGGYKAVVVHNADRMNIEAQSCFLKTLEEPKGKTLIILVSSKPEFLLSTIFSRCQTVKFLSNTQDAGNDAALGALLKIIQGDLAEKFQYAKKADLQGDNFNLILKALQNHFRNVMLSKIGVMPPDARFASTYSIDKIKNILRLIETLQSHASQTNASPKLALEILLMEI